MDDQKPKPMAGYTYAVITCTLRETVKDETTDSIRTWLVPMTMTFREALTSIIGKVNTQPKGRFTLSVPEELPFDPAEGRPAE